MIRICLEQLSLFNDETETNSDIAKTEERLDVSAISMRLLEAFSVSSIPFLGCDYETVYHDLEGI